MKIRISLEINILDENLDDLIGNIDDDVVPSLTEALESALNDNQYAYEPDSLTTIVMSNRQLHRNGVECIHGRFLHETCKDCTHLDSYEELT